MGGYSEADLQRARAEGWEQGAADAWAASGEGWNGEYPGDAEHGLKNPYRHERDGEKRYDVPCCYGKSCTTDIERVGDAWFRISNGDRYNLPVED